MMRISVIAFVVLGMASVTNAGLFISVDGVEYPPDSAIIVIPSDQLILGLTGDGQTPPNTAIWWIVEGSGMISGGVATYSGDLTTHHTYGPGDEYYEIIDRLETPVGEGGGGFSNVQGVAYTMLADGSPNPPLLIGKLVDEIDYHHSDVGVAVVTIVSTDLSIVYDTQVILEVPEPMTLALLGLGGLFLRRRK